MENFVNEIENSGFIPTYNIESELELLTKLDSMKPSTRIIRTKKGRTAIAALKNIEKNHNNSWYKEIKDIAEKNPDALALFYCGTKVTFKELIMKADEYANSLAGAGIQENDKIPACMANTPEFVYLLLAANKLGASITSFGANYDKTFIKTILKSCTNKIFFATDDNYEEISDVINTTKINKKIVISLADSLPKDPSACDEYEKELDEYYHFENKVDKLKKKSNILSQKEFLKYGRMNKRKIEDVGKLDSVFLTTFTSGSTKVGFPKPIIHTNRSLIVSGIFHKPEYSGNPRIDGLRGLAHIHTDSNTDIITCISDNLMQVWSVALSPIYDENKFLDVLYVNKPNYCNATKSFILKAAKQYLIDKKFNHKDMPFLLALFAVGEKTSKGEEKFINRFLKSVKAGSGVKINGFSLPYTTLCVGGGDTEHGGIYYSLWKGLFEKLYSAKLKGREYGMMPEPYVQITVLKKDFNGNYKECNYNEIGLIVSNSATTTKGYEGNKEATKKLIVEDEHGRQWVSNNVYGYIDELGSVHVLDRYENTIKFYGGMEIPIYQIEAVVMEDSENILSCEVTKCNTEYGEVPIINIEFQPFKKIDDLEIIERIKERLTYKLPVQVISNASFRVFEGNKSMPLTGSGKRSVAAIEKMGFDSTFKLLNKQICQNKNNANKLKLSR